MSVFDSLPSNRPIELLQDAKHTGQEIKAAQTRGSSSIVMNRIYSSNTWDFTMSGPGTVEVLFTPDNEQFGGAFCYRMYGRLSDQYGTKDIDSSLIKRKPNVGNKQRWLVPYDSPGTNRFKFYFFAQGSGTFTVKKL